MLNASPQLIEFIEALSKCKAQNLIDLMEKGLEVEKLEQLATNNPTSMDRISDGCVFLSFLYFRNFNRAA